MFDLMLPGAAGDLTPEARKKLTYLIQDPNNPRVKWEMGLVSARVLHMQRDRYSLYAQIGQA